MSHPRIFSPLSLLLCLILQLLFFIHRPVGMPKMEKVYLHNPSSEQISLISISATTAHFHASFFQNRVSKHQFRITLSTLISIATAHLSWKQHVHSHGFVLSFIRLFAYYVSWAILNNGCDKLAQLMKKLCVLLFTDVNSNMGELSAGINSKKSKQQPVHTIKCVVGTCDHTKYLWGL